MQTKRCSKCGEIKAVSEFNKNGSHRDGLSSHCKNCLNAYAAKYRRENRELVRERFRRSYRKYAVRYKQKMAVYREENREQIRQYGRDRMAKYKNGQECQQCGESHQACLEFHHRDPGQKEHDISAMVRAGKFSDEEILEEIAKCDVLCRNCHAKLHWETPGMWRKGFNGESEGD